jgi:hypothetical protein
VQNVGLVAHRCGLLNAAGSMTSPMKRGGRSGWAATRALLNAGEVVFEGTLGYVDDLARED